PLVFVLGSNAAPSDPRPAPPGRGGAAAGPDERHRPRADRVPRRGAVLGHGERHAHPTRREPLRRPRRAGRGRKARAPAARVAARAEALATTTIDRRCAGGAAAAPQVTATRSVSGAPAR